VRCKLDLSDLEKIGLARLYSALSKGASYFLAITDIRTHPISFASRPWKAKRATRSRLRRQDPFSISSIQLADHGGNPDFPVICVGGSSLQSLVEDLLFNYAAAGSIVSHMTISPIKSRRAAAMI
jgi:hypothetical protein